MGIKFSVDGPRPVRLVFSNTCGLRVVLGPRRNMGYMRVGCLSGVFARLVTLSCLYPVGDQ